MSNDATIATGTSFRFLTSGFSGLVTKILLEVDRERFLLTTFSTTVADTYNAKSTYQIKQITLDLLFEPSKAGSIPINGAAEIIQIVYPVAANSLWSTSGFIQGFEFGVPEQDLMSARLVLKGTGQISYYDRLPVFNDVWNAVYNDDSDLVYAG